jgi:hypothetical protein
LCGLFRNLRLPRHWLQLDLERATPTPLWESGALDAPSALLRRLSMASIARDIFVTGLRDAHAMETQARELMERQSERLTDYPDVQARMKEHLGETGRTVKATGYIRGTICCL